MRWFRPAVARMSDEELAGVLARVTRELGELRELFETLEMQHVKLRGRVYAKWKFDAEDPEQAGPTTKRGVGAQLNSKDDIRRAMTATGRFTPGKPPVHSE